MKWYIWTAIIVITVFGLFSRWSFWILITSIGFGLFVGWKYLIYRGEIAGRREE